MVSTCEGSCASFWPPVPVAGVAGSGGASAASMGVIAARRQPLTHPENPLLVLDSAGAAVVDSPQRGATANVTGIDPLSRREADRGR